MEQRKKSVGSNLYLKLIFMLLIVFSSFSTNVYASNDVLNEAKNIISNYYVEQVSKDVLNKPTIDGMVKALNDPYSEYFTKEKYNKFVDAINNTFFGIGIYKDKVPEGIKVISVIEGSPAEEANMRAGDIILKADGHELKGLSDEEAATYLKGREGSKAKLVIKRENKVLEFEVERRQIAIPTVEAKILKAGSSVEISSKDVNKSIKDNDLSGGTAYISISSFGEDTAKLFSEKLYKIREQNPSNYIIDLRYNGGGYMSAALDIAGHFIPLQPAIMVENRQGEKVKYRAPLNFNTIDKPVIFLINEYSASASEILSAAVKDYNKAFFIGKNTYGKGVAQNMFKLSDDSVIKLTVEKFYSPNGNIINKVGIAPNFEIKDDKIDPLKVAELLSGDSSSTKDKTGFLTVMLEGNAFEIDLNKARRKEYLAAYNYIIDKVKEDKILIGVDNNWNNLGTSDFFIKNNILYADYDKGTTLTNVSVDKKFTINFNYELDKTTIKEENIKLLDSESGKLLPIKFEKIEGTKLVVSSKTNLKNGNTYYLVVDGDIKGNANESILKKGYIVKVICSK